MTIKLYHCKGARSVRPLWTLEEMGIRGRETFLAAGGKKFALLECLNDSSESMTMLEALMTRELAGWLPPT